MCMPWQVNMMQTLPISCTSSRSLNCNISYVTHMSCKSLTQMSHTYFHISQKCHLSQLFIPQISDHISHNSQTTYHKNTTYPYKFHKSQPTYIPILKTHIPQMPPIPCMFHKSPFLIISHNVLLLPTMSCKSHINRYDLICFVWNSQIRGIHMVSWGLTTNTLPKACIKLQNWRYMHGIKGPHQKHTTKQRARLAVNQCVVFA